MLRSVTRTATARLLLVIPRRGVESQNLDQRRQIKREDGEPEGENVTQDRVGELDCAGTGEYVSQPLGNCSAASNQSFRCGEMYLTGLTSAEPGPPSPPSPTPLLGFPIASCWANKQVNGQTTQVAFFDARITVTGNYIHDCSYYDGELYQDTYTATFNTTGYLPHWLHFDVVVSGVVAQFRLNGTVAYLDTSLQSTQCPNTPMVVLLDFTGTAPNETAIASLVDLVANITGLAKENIQIDIVVSAKRQGYTVKVTMTGDANVSPQVASAALVDDFNNDPTAFETATGGTAGAASYPPPPPPPPPPPSPMPTPPTAPTTPTGPNSAMLVAGSLVVVSLLALVAL